MKTAVSLPEDVFRAIDSYARRHRMTRSGVLTAAARQYLARQQPADATAAWNAAIEAGGQPGGDPAASALRRRTASVVRRNRGW